MTGRARPEEPLRHWCEARLDCCEGHAVHRHHRKFRGRGGKDDAANTIDICDACHRYIHRHGEWAKEVGLAVSQYDPDPTEPWNPAALFQPDGGHA